ncbi:hypothetical protein [Herbidospora sp. RD11066]
MTRAATRQAPGRDQGKAPDKPPARKLNSRDLAVMGDAVDRLVRQRLRDSTAPQPGTMGLRLLVGRPPAGADHILLIAFNLDDIGADPLDIQHVINWASVVLANAGWWATPHPGKRALIVRPRMYGTPAELVDAVRARLDALGADWPDLPRLARIRRDEALMLRNHRIARGVRGRLEIWLRSTASAPH